MFTVYLKSAGGTKKYFTEFETEAEAESFCREYGWEWVDENEFVWDMDYEEAKCTNTAELQEELGVSRRTLRTDIAYLKRVYPDKLITHRGRYTGGLEWVE